MRMQYIYAQLTVLCCHKGLLNVRPKFSHLFVCFLQIQWLIRCQVNEFTNNIMYFEASAGIKISTVEEKIVRVMICIIKCLIKPETCLYLCRLKFNLSWLLSSHYTHIHIIHCIIVRLLWHFVAFHIFLFHW